jgi:DNA (cytosine-5)-methyltransferase 1
MSEPVQGADTVVSRRRNKPLALDLFCCGGGAGMGLHLAGFSVVGIDIEPQPHYPFPFIQADVNDLTAEWVGSFDFVWASPPCQRYTRNARQKGTAETHPDLVTPTRWLLQRAGLPFVIENVPDAPLRQDLLLCGSMFGLKLVRHRVFETHGFTVAQPDHGEHHPEYVTVTGNPGGSSKRDGGQHFGNTAAWREAMGIDWLPASRLKEAIPPAYSEHIGTAALAAMTAPAEAVA